MTSSGEESEVDRALDDVAALYAGNICEFGRDSRSVGWRDEASQRLRFAKLATVIDASDTPITVNDYGCGYGAMFPYLDTLPNVRLGRYFGYDISPEMLRAAEKVVDPQRGELIQSADLVSVADYTFVSGTFNVRMQASDAGWARHIEETIGRMAAKSRRGFAFNLLSTYVDWRDPNLFYADPLHFFDFCKRRISRFVALVHDYPLYEWTLVVRLNESSSPSPGAQQER